MARLTVAAQIVVRDGGQVSAQPRYYRVISGDGHLEPPPEDWTPWIPRQYQQYAPRTVVSQGIECWQFEGMPLTPIGPEATCGDDPRLLKRSGNSRCEVDGKTRRAGLGDAVQRLHEQDMDGIDAEVLFPPFSPSTFLRRLKDDRAYIAMVQAYNTWLAEKYCALAPDRLIGMAMMPLSGVEDAIAEVKRCKRLGLRGVTIKQWPSGGGRYTPEDDRFFAALLEEGVCLAPHISFGKPIPSVRSVSESISAGSVSGVAAMSLVEDRDNPERRFYGLKAANGTAGNIIELAVNGVFDRFPELKIYFGESKAAWINDWLENCMDVYAQTRYWYGVTLKRPLDEYVRGHAIFCFIRGSQEVHQSHLWGGENNLVWGSDLPHNASCFPFSRQWIDRAFDGEAESLRRQVLVETPAKLFGLDTARPLTATPPGGPYPHPNLAVRVPFVRNGQGRYVTVL